MMVLHVAWHKAGGDIAQIEMWELRQAVMDGPGRLLLCFRCRRGRGPMEGTGTKPGLSAPLCGRLREPVDRSPPANRPSHAVVTPEVGDIRGSEPDRLIGLVQRLVYLPAQGVEFRDIPVSNGIAWIEADCVAAFDNRFVYAAGTFESERRMRSGRSRRQAPPAPKLPRAVRHARYAPALPEAPRRQDPRMLRRTASAWRVRCPAQSQLPSRQALWRSDAESRFISKYFVRASFTNLRTSGLPGGLLSRTFSVLRCSSRQSADTTDCAILSWNSSPSGTDRRTFAPRHFDRCRHRRAGCSPSVRCRISARCR